MNILTAAILGLVEGLTEFLPISSTFHMIFASKLLHIPQNEFLTFFEVFIQAGAILAIVVVYFQYILSHKKYAKTILASFIPTAIVGLILHKVITKIFFHADVLMLAAFFVMGIVFVFVEFLVKREHLTLKKSIDDISIKQAMLIGLGQSFAVLPGVSRAGAVIISMMFLGYKRDESALYSFLLAVPTILAASALDLIKVKPALITSGSNLSYVVIGTVVSFVSALVVIKWFIQFLQKNTLTGFGIYRMIVAPILFFVK